MPKDRQGNERCAGYRREDHIVCPECGGKGREPTNGSMAFCTHCGGYGEVPKPKGK